MKKGDILVWLMVISAILIAVSLSGCSDVQSVKSKVQGLSSYWACMDGCTNMQQVFNQKYGIKISKEDHDVCAELCWQQYGG